jgi:hypothetical protein
MSARELERIEREPNAPQRALSCLWCERQFLRRATGGKRQKFCSSECRRRYQFASRCYVARELEAGRVTVADLRAAAETTRALLPGGKGDVA